MVDPEVEVENDDLTPDEIRGFRSDVRRLTAAVNRRTLAAVVIALFALCAAVAGIVASITAYVVNSDNQDQQEALEQVVDDLAAVVEANQRLSDRQVVVACQGRNSTQRAVRDAFDVVFELIEQAGAGDRTVTLIRTAQARLAETPDRDCDGNSRLDQDDYLT